MSLEKCLKYAIQFTDVLEEVHNLGIIHRNINPHSFIINERKNIFKLIDFTNAITQSQETLATENPNLIQVALAYISPEQTGRMNRVVDYRTDFYSLGVTLYEMLTGALPFLYHDPIELIHAHLAKNPLPPHTLNAKIPKIFSDIVLKLLVKSADDRYQSTWGIKADLQHCLDQRWSAGTISPFTLGLADIPKTLFISQKLYGRENEVKQLLDGFKEVCQGTCRCMMVTGYSGIGKTSIIHEMDKFITKQRGFFIHGKCDQYLHIPYSGIKMAFTGLIRYLLGESETVLNQWRDKIQEALGDNVQLMLDLIPDLALVVTKPTLKKNQFLDDSGQQKRLNEAFVKLIQLFSQKGHPLVLFLDDLQWADSASFSLLTELKSIKYLYLLGAYRSNEVSSTHPIVKTINTLAKENVAIGQIALTPLDYDAVQLLVADTLHHDLSKVSDLVKLIIEKTEGNPFFMIQFINMLYQEKMLWFDVKKIQWSWDIDKIKEKNITDNVIDLMIEKLNKLPDKVRCLISMAACLGNQFDLKILAIVYEHPIVETYHDLSPLIKSGYLVLLSEQQLSDGDFIKSELIVPQLGFLHDRVQQASYMLANEQQRLIYHKKIGEVLLKNCSDKEKDERLFEIVSHLNIALPLIARKTKKKCSYLNIEAAMKAKRAASYESALWYLKKAIELLSENNNHKRKFFLYKERVELEFLNGNFSESQHAFHEALRGADNNFEKAQLYIVPIAQLLISGEGMEAISLGKEALSFLGVTLPDNKNIKKSIIEEKAILDTYLKKRKISSLINLPTLFDPEKKLILQLLYKLTPSMHYLSEPMEAFLCLKTINSFIRLGNDSSSASCYATYGHIAISLFNDPNLGYEFGKLAINLNNKLGRRACPIFEYSALILPWIKELKYSIPFLEECFQLAISSGEEIEFGMFSLPHKAFILFFMGMSLDDLLHEIKHAYSVTKKYNDKLVCTQLEGILLVISNLKGDCKNRLDFSIDINLNENSLLTVCNRFNLGSTIRRFSILKAFSLYLYGEIEEAMYCIDLNSNDNSVRGTILEAANCFYQSMIYAELAAKGKKKKEYTKQINKNIKQLKLWVTHCPQNFSCMYNLVKAEQAQLNGNIMESINFYTVALESAQRNGVIQHIALANERQGLLWLKLGNRTVAKIFLQEAQNAYNEWGANAKVGLMYDQYPDLLGKASQEATFKLLKNEAPTDTNNSIDLRTLIKASQAISSEVSLSRVIHKLLFVLVENIGAQRGSILLNSNEQLFVEGEYNIISSRPINLLNSIPLNATENLPKTIIQFVRRSKEPVVIVNAINDTHFMNDPYVLREEPKSILCTPILYHNTLSGILYFENNLVTGAFTSDRLEILKILSAQIAISIENARLYDSFKSFVPEEFLATLHKKNIVDVRLGDHIQCDMAIMFADIHDFTYLAEKITPEETFTLINQFLAIASPIIKQYHGFIDKYLGDGIMALFVSSPDDALNAALAMQLAVKDFSAHSRDPVRIGIGLHWGQLILGTIGIKDRMDSTVVSDAVNLTSRLEGLTKLYGAPVLMSDIFLQHLHDEAHFSKRFLGKIRVKGRQAETMVYEVLDGNDPHIAAAKIKTQIEFEKALTLYFSKKFEEAADKFLAILKQSSSDLAAKIYFELAEKHNVMGVPEDWT